MQLSLIPNNNEITIHCSRYDTTLRKWSFSLYANDEVITPKGTISLVCENGAEIKGTISGNNILIDCTENISKESGIFKCKLKIVSGDEILYSSLFNLHCEVKV